jgi:hypothetical protein
LTITSVGEHVEKSELSLIHCCGNAKWCSCLRKQPDSFLKMAASSYTVVSYNPVISFLPIHFREPKTYFHLRICA